MTLVSSHDHKKSTSGSGNASPMHAPASVNVCAALQPGMYERHTSLKTNSYMRQIAQMVSHTLFKYIQANKSHGEVMDPCQGRKIISYRWSNFEPQKARGPEDCVNLGILRACDLLPPRTSACLNMWKHITPQNGAVPNHSDTCLVNASQSKMSAGYTGEDLGQCTPLCVKAQPPCGLQSLLHCEVNGTYAIELTETFKY
ncbi:hypothetical protein B0H13DRAFT_1887381 [Mycena leptocephala]|nr:hypothetical protein B0H13DRAFT_1887381 [Mycena leptocephala]